MVCDDAIHTTDVCTDGAIVLECQASDHREAVWWRKTDLAEDEAGGRVYNQWHAWYSALPRQARSFPGADKAYWKLWYQAGFNPEFAWKNTDPKQVHTFSRPLLKGEKPID